MNIKKKKEYTNTCSFFAVVSVNTFCYCPGALVKPLSLLRQYTYICKKNMVEDISRKIRILAIHSEKKPAIILNVGLKKALINLFTTF